MVFKLQLRHRAIGITAIALASALLILAILIVPIVSGIVSTSAEIRDLRAQLLVKKQATKEIRVALEQFRAAKAEVQTLETVFLKPGEELRLITSLEGVADATAVSQRIELAPGTVPGKDYKILPVTITLRGNALSVLRYLSLLPTLPLAVTVNSTSMGSDGSGAVTATLHANAYLR
ncbi:MAG: hypothetical protein AAB562_00380 [Patescibacteria group bacterium]